MGEQGDNRYVEFAANDYLRQVQRVAEGLRDIADRISREEPRAKAHGGDAKIDFTWHASQVVHEVQWGTANLPLARLIESASEADRAVRGLEPSE